jgi:NAD-dependent DNA ligase
VLDLCRRREVTSFPELLRVSRCVLGHVSGYAWAGFQGTWTSLGLLPSANPNADPSHPFYGREMVFTGALSSMTRAQAWEVIAARGGTPAPGATRRTSVLVVGFQDARRLRPGEALSSKARKAADLRLGGQAIEVMSEDDFFRLLEL